MPVSDGACDGTVRFTTPGAVFQLSSSYSVWSSFTLTLDASGLAKPVTILAAPGKGHFTLSGALVSSIPLVWCSVLKANQALPTCQPSDGLVASVMQANLTANNIIFKNAYSASSGANVYGGSIAVWRGSMTMTNSSFVNNTAYTGLADGIASGGAIYFSMEAGRSLHLINTSFASNAARAPQGTTMGGAVYVRGGKGVVLVKSCLFSGNTASGSTSTSGGTSGGSGDGMDLLAVRPDLSLWVWVLWM